MQQVARERALTRFRDGKVKVLVATDVAARGIDVADVTHVINYSCPEDDKTYVHRIGRTGRAGATGVAVTLVDWADVTRWKVINRALNLPFDEIPETYSTSEHLYHDMGVPPGTKGRIVPERPAREERTDDRAERPRGNRNRRRTRGGEPAGGSSGGSAATREEQQPGSAPKRTRSRRRTRQSASRSGD
jgi:superfamily II DNA/RNA helicase